MKKILVVLAASMALAGCISIPKNCSIWFENKSGETITCSVDGTVVFTVDPGQKQVYSMASGTHAWEAKSEKHYWHGTVDLGWGEVTGVAIETPDS
jgi:hypothetical protein